MSLIARHARPLMASMLVLAITLAAIRCAPTAQAPSATEAEVARRVAAGKPAVQAPSAKTQAQTVSPRYIIFSAEHNGRTELYAATDGEDLRQLTRGYSPARAPALAPDGTRLAFQSRRDGNWEIYVLDLLDGRIRRLTNNLAYDGAPTWSPDGRYLAFESYRSNDLDIWRMDADGSNPINLTPDEEAYDYAPSWSPDGTRIVFTSWATGNKQIFSTAPEGGPLVNLSQNRFHDEQPAWSPDGKQLAFVSNREACSENVKATVEQPPPSGSVASGNCQRRNIYIGTLDNNQLTAAKQITFSGRDLSPTFSPDGRQVAFVSPRPDGQALFIVPVEGGLPRRWSNNEFWVSSAVWSNLETIQSGGGISVETPLYQEQPLIADAEEGHPYRFRAMREIYLAPSWGLLSSRVAQSFLALRQRVLTESGLDFLARLSDMTRLVSSRCDHTCDDLSWHKSGRAVDTLLSFPANGKESLLLVREDLLGETYWRVYLRARAQDGSMGEPVKDAPWDLSARARTTIAPGLGGAERPIEYGYYVDFTELARIYGWNRISTHDDPDFDWRNNREALEFWHFQKEDSLSWWQAMQEVYSPGELAETFDWHTIVNEWGREPARVYLKNIPPRPDAWKWFALAPLQ